MLRLEWDEKKNRRNRSSMESGLRKREAFLTIRLVGFLKTQSYSQEEEPLIILGTSAAARVLVIVRCHRSSASVIRIISARKATKREIGFYEEGVGFRKYEGSAEPLCAPKKKAVGINLSPEVIDYFKGLALQTGLPYQKRLICTCWIARRSARS